MNPRHHASFLHPPTSPPPRAHVRLASPSLSLPTSPTPQPRPETRRRPPASSDQRSATRLLLLLNPRCTSSPLEFPTSESSLSPAARPCQISPPRSASTAVLPASTHIAAVTPSAQTEFPPAPPSPLGLTLHSLGQLTAV
ncbi:uncharacterized protein A4U43_C07F22520 [Asparagus officinalis]|uniref:Uncharacterized protein n=1 Tax=Asparagus officinalis TaxID=4686 RepID=A0A5P1EE59_ASPOF|nr:uncharacterized protein A4U43_C07F22520 [Asparagus officinalis]